jgi:hypothetical protein
MIPPARHASRCRGDFRYHLTRATPTRIRTGCAVSFCGRLQHTPDALPDAIPTLTQIGLTMVIGHMGLICIKPASDVLALSTGLDYCSASAMFSLSQSSQEV